MKCLALIAVLVGIASAAPKPQSKATLEDVNFLLWTTSNTANGDYQELFLNDPSSVSGSYYNGNDPTVVLIHGWGSNGYGGWPVQAKTELVKAGSYNVISIDWSELATQPNYPASVNNVPLVGGRVAEFLEFLVTAGSMDISKLEVTGHSLGAHVSGAVGQNLKDFRLPRITGMDPAGPFFENRTDSERLDPSDADFVQVIHTNGGGVLEGCVGFYDRRGDVDFYPNGGDHMPGCTWLGEDWTDLLVGGCSHSRSHDYWIESINGSPGFSAASCSMSGLSDGSCNTCSGSSCVQMGFYATSSASGVYYLETTDSPPYALG
ncbi:hypothetical protein Pcinc_035504 [Petrolisthes cinctipes]|uniref:Lipase domain-containing protein n=1 Tax=Petrolisthes cinctipes TaxID=88211 RepID=A0AAE1BXM1_PETCI|nr:hypothetical protein Pcinc_035504 [Petrolisthes cinctipes]